MLLEERVRLHPKKELVHIVRGDWTELARSGKLKFSDDTLVVAFVDPTGISQIPMDLRSERTFGKDWRTTEVLTKRVAFSGGGITTTLKD
jgi:hypothetical protein